MTIVSRLRTRAAWVALLLGIVLMAPGLLDRLAVEQANDTYEFTIGNTDLVELLRVGGDGDDVYDRLTDAGLISVAVEVQTLAELELAGRVTSFTHADLVGLALFAGEPPPPSPEESATYLAAEDGLTEILDRIRTAHPLASIESVTVGSHDFQRVSGLPEPELAYLGFDDELIGELRDRGIQLIARLPADVPSVEFATAELGRLSDSFGVDRVLFTGSTAPFDEAPAEAARLATWMNDAGFNLLTIELFEQAGMGIYLDRMDHVIRLHSISFEEEPDPEAAIDRSVRAVKERNIRIILLRPFPTLEGSARIDGLARVMSGAVEAMPPSFQLGAAAPFGELRATPLLTLGALLASVAMAAALGGMLAGWAAVLAGGGTALLGIAWAVSGSSFLGDLLRLGIAVTAAVLALYVARPALDLGRATIEYAKAGLIVIAGGLTVTGLAYGTEFLTAAHDFWGVKALLIAPIVLAAAVALYLSLGKPGWRDGLPIARLPIEVWQVVAVGIVAAAGWYLLLRSGNTGAATDIELLLRQQLEDLLFVRPRTKEFLIGFPALLIGIMLAARTRHGWWMYVVAAIGTASAVDTFTHFHAPLAVSLLRTAYAIAFGYVAGLVGLAVLWALVGGARRIGHRIPGR